MIDYVKSLPCGKNCLGFFTVILFFYAVNKITIFLHKLFTPFKKGKKYWCRVKTISDGDTLTCYRLNLRRSETKLRFAYVDAPESSQAFGKESQQMVSKLVKNKLVRVQITDIDRYGRCVGVIYHLRKNVNETLIKQGSAWVYEEYIRDKNHLNHMLYLQNQAKKQKKVYGKLLVQSDLAFIVNSKNLLITEIFSNRCLPYIALSVNGFVQQSLFYLLNIFVVFEINSKKMLRLFMLNIKKRGHTDLFLFSIMQIL